MKISIITVSYNSAKTISETIESVLMQDYRDIEYIIFDGQSTDGTQDIVRSFGSRISKFVSEKDNGLYDAMNKAIDVATGDVVAILNSDDLYATPQTITHVMKAFADHKVDAVFGDLYYFRTGDTEKSIRYYSAKTFKPEKVKMGLLPPHPSFFVKRAVYAKYGKFDLQFRYASDFDLMSRFLCVHKVSYHYLPEVIVKMRMGGISTVSLGRIIEINKEDLASCKKNGIRTNFFLFHFKYFEKVFHIKSFSDWMPRLVTRKN
jgi:glycosyltransferase involved in cell wall biosynthesis